MMQYINIDENPYMLIPEVRREIREIIAADTLQTANEIKGDITPRDTFYTKYVKRLFDIVLSFFALIVTSPINLILAICTFFDVGRPIIFRQKRTGKDKQQFTIIKFRNMRDTRDKNGTMLLGKDRVTKFGKFVRRTSLDELLNFVSIFRGDMSLIGPRPLPDAYTDFMCNKHQKRYSVRPGLECPFLRPLDHKVTWGEQFDNDAWYAENVSFSVDLKMILALVKAVFNRKSSAMRGASERGSFMGYYSDGTSINSQKVPDIYLKEIISKANEFQKTAEN